VFRESRAPEGTSLRRPPQQAYLTKDDRYVLVMPYTEQDWQALGRLAGVPELTADASLSTRRGRDGAAERYAALLVAAFVSRTLAEWQETLAEAGIPHAPVQTREEFSRHPHVWENDILVQQDQPSVGPVTMIAPPIQLSATPGRVARPAPAFGQHTREVLAEAGLNDSEIEELLRAGVAR